MKSWSVIRAIARGRRAGLLRLRPSTAETGFHCLGARCGKCCSVLGGGVVEKGRDQADAASLVPSCGGSCAFLANGLCSSYRTRPRGCQEYPWYNVNGRLFYDRGCPGIIVGQHNQPEAISIEPIQAHLLLPGFLRRLAVALMTRW